MRKRNPVALVIVGFAVLLGIILVVGNARRAQDDPALATTTSRPAEPDTTEVATRRTTTTADPAAPTTAARPTTTVTLASGVSVPKGMRSISASALPRQARDTLALIAAGGPFPYDQDGAVFQNREKLLPAKKSGYYHEYTVETPGSPDRGARRIITGDGGERYYTDDHYASFRWVVP